MLRTVRYRWPVGARFAFNCYRHWAQILLRQPGEPPLTILIREGLTQGDPLLVILYGITLVPVAEELRAENLVMLSTFYANDAMFDGSSRQNSQILKLLMDSGPDRGYYPDPDKSLFVLDTPGKKEATRRKFAEEGLVLNYVSGGRYLGKYLGP